MKGTMFDDLIQLTFPNGQSYDFIELPKHKSGDRIFRVRSAPPKGQTWNLRNLERGTPVQVGTDVYVKIGSTGGTIRLRPMEAAA